jgi:hypothetical protein
LYDFAQSVGCERIYSYMGKDGKPLNFYAREGFNVIGTVGQYCQGHGLAGIDGEDFDDAEDFVILKKLTDRKLSVVPS